MHLRTALGVESADEIDSSLPLVVGRFRLGSEAAEEAIRILRGGEFAPEVRLVSRVISEPIYWSVSHQVEGNGEILSVPGTPIQSFPTAMEVAFLRALAAIEPGQQHVALNGNIDILLGHFSALNSFYKVVQVLRDPLTGSSVLYKGATQAVLDTVIDTRMTAPILNCLANAFKTTPLKFRFLELYRMMESRFLDDVKNKLLALFYNEPTTALNEASEALKSELAQVIGLAETQQDAFEACWLVLDTQKNSNRFCSALFRKLGRRGPPGGVRWKNGAALIYYIRCAIVHAGEKDIVFDSFADGENVISDLMPFFERASLCLIGIRVN